MREKTKIAYGCLCLCLSGVSGYKLADGFLTGSIAPAYAAVSSKSLSNNGYQIDRACSYSKGCITVPIKRRDHGVPILDVELNGRYVCEFLLDTGASKTTVPYDAVVTLGLQPNGSIEAAVADGRTVNFDTSRVEQVEIGGLLLPGTDVAISGMGVGLIGQNILANYDVVIKHDTVEFHTRK